MLNQVLILLFFSVLGLALFRRLNFPTVLGYLVVGMLAGQHALGLIHHSHAIEQIAEIGVVFLLFTLGLEVSIPRLISMRRIVFGIGSIQVLVSTLSTMAIGLWLDLSWQASFAVGGALAMSSTAIAVKQLSEQRELHSRHGNIALGVLLFQDLAVVPFLVLIPIFAAPAADSTLMPIVYALAKGAFAFIIIYLAGQYLLRPAIRAVALTHLNELFTLFVLLVALLAAGLTWELGLSLAMGAFLAGIMLAETEFQHHVELEIRPFRDVLMGLFFISVGSQFDWTIIINEPLAVIILTLGLVFGKGVAIMCITRWAGFEKGVAIRAGLVLGQGSEFGFALLALALSTGLLEIGLSQPIIAAIIISMALSPMLIRHNEAITHRLAPGYISHHQKSELDIEHACENLKDHVILCGFGRTGQNLSLFLKRVNIPFIALEINADLISEAWEAGDPVYYGDSSRAETLAHAGIHNAKALVISFPEINISEHITRSVKRLRADLPLIVRTRDDRHLERLLECGADEVIPDTLESSMMLARHTLSVLGLGQPAINEMLIDARQNHYARIRAFFHTADDIAVDNPDYHHMHSIEILDDSYANGKILNSLKCLNKVNIIALRRNGVRSEAPLLDIPLKSGDVLVVKGRPDDIQCAEIEVMCGL